MKKILCPTDFSDTANNAIVFAAKYAKNIGADLTLFNVPSVFETTTNELIRGKSMTYETIVQVLETQSHEIATSFHIGCYSEVQSSSGSLANIISEKSESFDMIIMGTNGADDIYQFLSGSNTYKVIRASSVPVLLIPDGCGYAEIDTIVYAFDYLHDYKLPINQLLHCTAKQDLSQANTITVLQLTESLSEEKEFELKELQRQIMNFHQDKNLNLQFDTVYTTEVAKSIDGYMIDKNADLLALCTHNYGFLENLFHVSVIKTISGIASYPVFVFHE